MRPAVTVAVLAGFAGAAHAQVVDRQFAEEPTDGLFLPTTPLAGEHDARSVVANPGGIALLRGTEIVAAASFQDSAVATSAGPGFGLYGAQAIGGGLFPRFGIGYGLEWLRPPRATVLPDPGTPFRLTVAWSSALGRDGGIGLSWHHFFAEGALSGVDAFDLGVSTRWGNHVAIGGVVRDLATRAIGGAPTQRRYGLETVLRPLATDRLEVALGGQLGETRLDFTAWGRAAVRVHGGLYALAQVEQRDLHELVMLPTGTRDTGGHELRATLGIEVSLGHAGVTMIGTGARTDSGAFNALGGTVVARLSAVGVPSVLGHSDHIERVELSGEVGTRELTEIVMRLRAIARDRTVKALVVTFDGVDAGFATLEELHDEIALVRRAGKHVYSYMVTGTGRDYYIATAAEKIFVDPAGAVRLTGMASTAMYFRGSLDLLGVTPEFVKIAEWKTAPEQFTEKSPSETAANQRAALVDSLWGRWRESVAKDRHLTAARVQEIVDGGPYSAGDLAKDRELVDAVATPEKVSQTIAGELGAIYPVDRPQLERPDRWHHPGVAVIYIDGDIVDGSSKQVPFVNTKLVGGNTVITAIQDARSDPRVGAIVLRIDSPGGSALASELIAREVFATRGFKPIICSFGNLAASGGYFVAAGCDAIFAEPMTITGSIGIFSGKLDISGLLEKVGVTTSTYKTAKRADLESMYRPFTDEEKAVMLDKIRYIYSRFVGAVAEGRKLTKQAVDDVGRGHVYTGEQALPLHLVDRYGGLGDAVEDAKQRMHLASGTEIELIELPKVPVGVLGWLNKLFRTEDERARAAWTLADLPMIRELLRAIPPSLLVAPDVPQARLPFQIIIE